MNYGGDLALSLLLPASSGAAAVSAGRLTFAPLSSSHRRTRFHTLMAAGGATAGALFALGFAIVVLRKTGWSADPQAAGVHAALTLLPALMACLVGVPRVLRLQRTRVLSPNPGSTVLLLLPFQVTVMAAGMNAVLVVVPHPPWQLADAVVVAVVMALWVAIAGWRISRRTAVRPTRGASLRRLGATWVAVACCALVWWTGSGIVHSDDSGGERRSAGAQRMAGGVVVGHVTTGGAVLYYEARGSGPPLLMISGGGGDAGFYQRAAEQLAVDHRVITYDRRANSRSTGDRTATLDMDQQARDAVAVLGANGYRRADVFGNSGGAIIALHLATTFPSAVDRVVAHEPPAVQVLPDADRWSAMFDSFGRSADTLSTTVASLRFSLSTKIPMSGLRAVPSDLGNRLVTNQDYFVSREMRAFVGYRPDVATMKRNRSDVVLAVGRYTRNKGLYYGRTAMVLSRELGQQVEQLPGHHLSYLEEPVDWADSLCTILHQD